MEYMNIRLQIFFFPVMRFVPVVKPGEKFFGSFTIKNKEQKRIRGFLYSSDARVACEPREFSGIEPKLSFDVDFTGMKAGDVLEGSLTVCTNMGEKALPFSFAIMQKKVQLPAGEAFTLDSFAQLAKEHYEKAYAMFCSGVYKDDRKAVSAV